MYRYSNGQISLADFKQPVGMDLKESNRWVKKAPTKGSELDRFLVSGDMSQFDNLFDAMGIYSNYKEYTNSVISEEDMLLNEIYEKFVEM